MQNPYVKYLRMPKGGLHIFYHENKALLQRTYTKNSWSSPILLADETTPVFSLCQYRDTCFILYSSPEGKLFIASSEDLKSWDHYPLTGAPPTTGKTKYFVVPEGDKLHLIYHLPTEMTGVEYLVYSSYKKGKWEKPYEIDRFMPFGKTPFLARRLSHSHIILYYRSSKNTWSAREMLLSPYTMGSLTPIIQSAGCTDISIVNDMERIHILYIVRGMFRTQVAYQYKQTTAISAPRILWEDASCDNCLVYLEKGKLILMWTANGHPMRCISENNGTSFGSVERFMGRFPAQCMKGELIGVQNDNLNSGEAYGDTGNGYTPFLFSSAEAKEPPVPIPPEKKNLSPIPPENAHTVEKEIEELRDLLAKRNDEITAVNAARMAQNSRLEAELSKLRQENETLRRGAESSINEKICAEIKTAERPDGSHDKASDEQITGS